ncbi:hypothetical protein LIER_11653 [Lithospermum erythrorhizon]|uniref:Uncharacterized protein n=1 Tax=Lithospermum erythrorhizon TaxID=34254 RepID=A0AAV3PR47_LITER
MIDEIARAGVGVKGPTPYKIAGPILDAEVEEICTSTELRHLMKDRKKVDDDYKPIDVTHIFHEDNVVLEWLDIPGDPLLDEFEDDTSKSRSNTFLATWAERLGGDTSDEGHKCMTMLLMMKNLRQ